MQKTGLAVWEPVEIPQKKCARWRFPQKNIWVERVESEWHVLSTPGTGKDDESSTSLIGRGQKPVSSFWKHYLHRGTGPLQPSPVLPDRPIVVRPDRSLTILPGQSTIFFLELPVWFKLSITGHQPARIFEEPLSALTRTWFGDPVTGELCWGLATRLHHSLDSVGLSAYIAVCPLMIENTSETDLGFEKICIHAENLSEQPPRPVHGARAIDADGNRAHAAGVRAGLAPGIRGASPVHGVEHPSDLRRAEVLHGFLKGASRCSFSRS